MTGREKAMISLAVVTIGIAAVMYLFPAVNLSSLVQWPDQTAAAEHLSRGDSLIRSARSINTRFHEVTELEKALVLTENPKDLPAVAINAITSITTNSNVKLEEIKPGISKQEGKYQNFLVQVQIKGAGANVMDFLVNLRVKLPMARLARLTLNADNGAIDATLAVEFLTNGVSSNSKTMGNRRTTKSLSEREKSRYLTLVRQWVHGEESIPNNWNQLAAAFASVSDDTTNLDSPQLLGVVTFGKQVQALIGLGSNSWYFSTGQTQNGIEVLSIRPNLVVVRYQGRMLQLYPQSSFTVSSLKS
jgi:hypothetical protein